MPDMSNQDIRLAARMSLAERHAVFEYEVENLARAPLFLFNLLHGEMNESGTYPIDRRPYVEIGREAVVVSVKLFPVPELTFVEKPNIPFVTRVPPGHTFRDSLSAPLPLATHNPYAEPVSGQGRSTQERPALFELGYFVGKAGTEELGTLFPTDQGPRPGFDVFTASDQKLARVGPLGSVPVRPV